MFMRYDIKGKEILKTNGKFYMVDLGSKNTLLGFKNIDRGHALENIVFLELLRRGYDVSIGKAGNKRVDFRVVDTWCRLQKCNPLSLPPLKTSDLWVGITPNIFGNHYNLVVRLLLYFYAWL